MSVYGSQHVEGKIQDIRLSDTSAHIFWVPRLGGMDIKPTTAYYMIYNSAGTALTSTSASFGLCTTENEAWLEFAALSARFNSGYVLSQASQGFSATIRDVQYTSATAGRVYLVDLIKTVTSGSAVVDNGDTPGAATTVGAPYSPILYCSFSASSTSYDIGENYRLSIRWTYASQTHYDHVYFDVVKYPLDVLTTSRMIDDRHPDWTSMRPKEWQDWKPAIHTGHAELCRRIRGLGGRGSFIPKREELMPLEMAFVEAAIARDALAFEREDRARWIKNAEDVWAARGEFSYAEARDDNEIDSTPVVFSSRMTR
jgi:hypothetical protein